MTKVLDTTFTIDSDKYNWILREKNIGKKVRLRYFSNIKQLSKFVGEYKLREFLVKGDVDLLDKSSLTPSYSSVIEESLLKLERYIQSLIDNTNSELDFISS